MCSPEPRLVDKPGQLESISPFGVFPGDLAQVRSAFNPFIQNLLCLLAQDCSKADLPAVLAVVPILGTRMTRYMKLRTPGITFVSNSFLDLDIASPSKKF